MTDDQAQYWIAVNKTKREWIHPHRFGDGLKFDDFKHTSGGFLTALAYLLAEGKGCKGRWAGDEVAIAGDDDPSMLYDEAMDSWKDVSFEVIRLMSDDPTLKAKLKTLVAWRRVPVLAEALADQEEHDVYTELFGEVDSKEA